MPWQRRVVDVAGELDPDTGLLAYREVVVTVPRQSGKTTWTLATEVDRCVSWEGPQRVIYTAQTGHHARKKLVEDHAPIVESSDLAGLVDRVFYAAGDEAVRFRDGSRITTMASKEDSGHGWTVDLGVVDEAWKDEDDRREQALLPAMITIPDAQLLVTSTAGTAASVYLRRKVEEGRHAAERDTGSGVAYFEYSAPPEADPDDEDVWRRCMPALGRTVSLEAVRHARQTMEDAEFRRAFLNQWTEQEHGRVIPEQEWLAVCDAAARPEKPFTFAADVLPDRSAAALAVAGGGAVELLEHREGAGWLVDRTRQVVDKWGGRVVIDGNGPARPIGDDLEREGVDVDRLKNAEVAAACGRMYDAVADRTIWVRRHPLLDEAVAGLAKRPVGDRFVWSRSTSTSDVTPLMAATLAHDGARQPQDTGGDPSFAFV